MVFTNFCLFFYKTHQVRVFNRTVLVPPVDSDPRLPHILSVP